MVYKEYATDPSGRSAVILERVVFRSTLAILLRNSNREELKTV